MSNKTTVTPIAAAIGTAFAISLSTSPLVNATENPFGMNAFDSGYQVAEGACGESKDAQMSEEKKEAEGKCGEEKKEAEGKCGENKEGEGKCGENKEETEGKCGEGKCGDK